MGDTLEILNTLFKASYVLAGVFFVFSVVLFFVFDIRSIFNIRTGRTKKKTVQEMQDANSRTEVLKTGKTGQRTRRGSITGPLDNRPNSGSLGHNAVITPAHAVSSSVNEQYSVPSPETEVLTPETSVLQPQQYQPISAFPSEKGKAKIGNPNYRTVKRILLINTEEIVC